MAVSEDAQAIIDAITAQTTALNQHVDALNTTLTTINTNIATVYDALRYVDAQGSNHTLMDVTRTISSHAAAIDSDTDHLATIDADTDHLDPIDRQTKSIDEAEKIQLKARSNEMGYREYSKDEVESDITTKLG